MKKNLINGAFALLAATTLVVFAGCKDKSRPSDLPDGVACTVSVVQDGQPLADAEVMLVGMDEANKKYSPGGRTDAKGDCELKTYGYPGVAPGKYKVTIWKDVEEGGETIVDEETGEETYVGGAETMTVDTTFRDAATTTLEIDIQAKMEKPVFDVGESISEPKR